MKITKTLFGKKFIQSAILKTEKEITIKAPWGKITGVSWGDVSKPAVLLCHGKMDCSSSFRPLVSLLPQDYFYVSIDLPGNGRSDRLPSGVMYSVMDMVPSLKKVQDHFKWDNFTFIGHSLGCHVGIFHATAYPNTITRAVHLDPQMVPRLITQDLRKWYMMFYKHFYDNYEKLNSGIESAPKYRYEEIRGKMMAARSLTEEAVEHVLERCLLPAGDGLYQIVFDQRQRNLMFPPISSQQYQQLWTGTKTPVLSIIITQSITDGFYKFAPYIMDDNSWPNKDHRHIIMDGVHDIHLNNPENIVDHIKVFLEDTSIITARLASDSVDE